MKKLFFVFLFLASSAVVSAEDWVSCTSILAPPPYIDTYVASKYGKSWYLKDFYIDKSRIYTNGKGYYTIFTKTLFEDGTYHIAKMLYDINLNTTQFLNSKYYYSDGTLYKEYGGEGKRIPPAMSIAEYKFDCVKKATKK